MASVQIQSVRKNFGNTPVLHGVDIDIADGTFTVLVGPSGCGKSTLLRMIAGLEEISSGEIRIGDRRVNDVPPKERDIAMVFQNYALYPHMTVRQNMAFSLMLAKADKATVDSKVARAAEVLALTPLLDRYPRQLSGGQRQRVAMGRAIVRAPQVFLFDEPLSNLDAKLRVAMRAEIKKLQQRLQVTSVYVTHDQIEAMTMGHRIAVLKEGKLQQLGTPLEVYERPANIFVAQFIGSPPMNFLDATLDANGTTLVGDGFTLPVPQSMRAVTAGKGGRKIKVGIRPDHLLGPEQAARGETATLTPQVEIVEPLGNELIVHSRMGENSLVSKLPPQHTPEPGAKLPVVVELDALHLFDAETEQRLSA